MSDVLVPLHGGNQEADGLPVDVWREVVCRLSGAAAKSARAYIDGGARLSADAVATLAADFPELRAAMDVVSDDRRAESVRALPVEWTVQFRGRIRDLLVGTYFGCSGRPFGPEEVRGGIHPRAAEFEVLR